MSVFVFDDIYGNQSARQRYEHHREFSYFNTILKLQNKYYEDNEMHHHIFSPRKTQHFSPSSKHSKDPNFLYYSVERINNLTFRISKHKKKSQQKPRTPYDRQSPVHDILKDASQIKKVLSSSKKVVKNNAINHKQVHDKQSHLSRANRLNLATINREIRYFATPTLK